MKKDKQRRVVPLLKEIASRLWDGRAAVLIGAGFSRNAQPTSSNSRKFPMWNDLGDLFHDKIYSEKNNNNYSNVLKLADEVDAAFGRSALDKMILDNVPDKEYEPSELHKQLLHLPWADVFTTNYDTLLERTCVFIDSKKYDIVINKNDLINAEKPRIIKLHGSFPSERPFIITEEDYRNYPKKFSPFVNTVQQALIENTLCLIGFSGDDPNFLNWIGWIRDNLDDNNSPKIFLISLSDFNEAQRKLLEKRNIVIIDLSLLGDFDGNHFKAHTAFIEFLNENRKKEFDIDWPNNITMRYENIHHGDTQDIKKLKLINAMLSWRKERECYPGWCIAPEEKRKSIWYKTRDWLNVFEEIESWEQGEDLNVAYELTWRINICLLPIFDNTAASIATIIEKYCENLDNGRAFVESLPLQLPTLLMSLLRYYRQEGDRLKWHKLHTLTLKCRKFFSLLDEAKLNYESVLFSYSNLKFDEAFDKLSRWDKNELLPFMEAKRAGILAELGHVDDAISILESSLNTIRKNNFITSKNDDLSSSSQEAYIMLLLYFIKKSGHNPSKNTDEEYDSRWAKLSQYKCDPKIELKIFEIRLEGWDKYTSEDGNNNDFDIGKRSTSLNFGFPNVNKLLLDSFSFLIFCEEIALPPRIPQVSIVKSTFGKSSAIVYEHCPAWALFTFLRIGDEKIIENFFDRELISKMERNDVQETLDFNFQALKSHQLKIKVIGDEKPANIYNSFVKSISELLSRLVTKSHDSKKIEIIEFISTLYLDPHTYNLNYFSKLLERTISSLSNEKKVEALPIFLKFPIKPLNSKIRPNEFTNPFLYITDLSRKGVPATKLKILNQDINNFINDIKENDGMQRTVSSVKMIVLYQLGYVNKSCTIKLIKALWRNVDSFGFPKDAGYRRFYFIRNLFPNDKNTKELILGYIDTLKFPIIKNESNEGIPITNGRDDYCLELLGSINTIDLDVKRINSILLALNDWFEKDKELLKHKNPDVKSEMEKKFENITRIVTTLCSRFQTKFDKEINILINQLVSSMRDYGLRVTPAVLMLHSEDSSTHAREIHSLCISLRATDKKKILSSLRSLSEILETNIDCSDALICLSEKIKWNAGPEISNCLAVSESAINKKEFIKKEIFIENIVIGLERILEELSTDVSKRTYYLDTLETKISAAKIASCIYKLLKGKNKDIPTIVSNWKALCGSSDEFDEVKNSWID